jgi:hypothetical protein
MNYYCEKESFERYPELCEACGPPALLGLDIFPDGVKRGAVSPGTFTTTPRFRLQRHAALARAALSSVVAGA